MCLTLVDDPTFSDTNHAKNTRSLYFTNISPLIYIYIYNVVPKIVTRLFWLDDLGGLNMPMS